MEEINPPTTEYEEETLKVSNFLDIDKAKCCFCDTYKGALIRLYQGWCCVSCFKKLLQPEVNSSLPLEEKQEGGNGIPPSTKVGSFQRQEKTKMAHTKIKQDIERLKEIHQELEEHYFDDEWNLCEFHKDELYRITGIEEHDWDETDLAHYIDGMQRAIHLKEVYDE